MTRTLKTLAALAALALAGTAHAQHYMKSVEEGLESEAKLTMLPAGGIGTLVARSCMACEEMSMTLSAMAELRVNGQRVTFEQFQDAAIRNPGAMLMVFYRIEDRQVTRLSLSL
jgi:hypothetical protein